MKLRSLILVLPLCAMLQTACSNQAAYTSETFSTDSPFKLRVDEETASACESVRRALLGQGYLIDLSASEEIKARKATKGEGSQNTFIEMNVVCAPERTGSTIFATGVLSTYALKTNSSSASVGLSALGSISLPIGQSVDSLVKVSEATIDDKGFYQRFFAAVDIILDEMQFDDEPVEPAVDPVAEDDTSEPAPVRTHSAIWPELFPETSEPQGAPASLSSLESEAAPAQMSYQDEPVAVPEQIAAQPDAATTVESIAVAAPVAESIGESIGEPVGSSAVHNPDDEPFGIAPAPGIEEATPTVSPAPGMDDEPLGISPAPSPAVTGAAVSAAAELAPVQVTAVPRPISVPAKAVQKPTGNSSEDAPDVELEDIF